MNRPVSTCLSGLAPNYDFQGILARYFDTILRLIVPLDLGKVFEDYCTSLVQNGSEDTHYWMLMEDCLQEPRG